MADIRKKIEKHFKAGVQRISDMYNVDLEMTSNGDFVLIKFAGEMSGISKEYLAKHKKYKLKREWLGKSFLYKNKEKSQTIEYEIIGLDPSKTQYKVFAIDNKMGIQTRFRPKYIIEQMS